MARPLAIAYLAPCLVAGVFGASACDGTVSVNQSSSVSKSDLERYISQKVSDSAGNPVDASCPSDLNGVVGTKLNCQVTSKNDKNDTSAIAVTVTGLEGNNVNFDIVEIMNKNKFTDMATDYLAQQLGHKPDSLNCPDDLLLAQGASVRCEFTDGGATSGVTATVTKNGSDSHVDFKIDAASTTTPAP
jgi:hypothetical protein